MASVPNARAKGALSEQRQNPLTRSKQREKADLCAGPQIEGQALSSLINAEIIPRLMMVHSPSRPARIHQSESEITPKEAAGFATLPLQLEADDLLKEIESILERGVSPESIFVDLLAPSARKLGQMWEEDSCDFVDVTMGLWRLQEVMRAIPPRAFATDDQPPHERRVLFSPLPGEQHSFGTLMIEEIFAQAGWQSEVLLEPTRSELLRVVSDMPFDLIGLTISCDCPSGSLKELITAIRGVSKISSTRILIGGRLINANPDMVDKVGADGTAADARSALDLAESLIVGTRQSVAPHI